MPPSLIPICRGTLQQAHAFLPFSNEQVACFLHCAGILGCAVLAGAGFAALFLGACRLFERRRAFPLFALAFLLSGVFI